MYLPTLLSPISMPSFSSSLQVRGACGGRLCFARATTSGFGRGATRPPSITSDTESKIPVTDVAGRAEPFIVAMLDLFPALLTNCDHRRCLSHVGTEGNVSSAGKRQPQKT